MAGKGDGSSSTLLLSMLINVADFDLNRGVVVGGDERVGGGALSWDVQVDDFVLIVLHYQSRILLKQSNNT